MTSQPRCSFQGCDSRSERTPTAAGTVLGDRTLGVRERVGRFGPLAFAICPPLTAQEGRLQAKKAQKALPAHRAVCAKGTRSAA